MKKHLLKLVLLLVINTPLCFGQLTFIPQPDAPGITVSSERMNGLEVDAANNKWVPFASKGIGMFDGVNWTMFNVSNSGMPTDSAICITFEGSGNAWIGTKEGAVYKSGTSFTVYNTSNSGLPSNLITTNYSEAGLTWFGTNSGLVSYNGSTWLTYNTSNSGIANDSITAIVRDQTGNLWVGTRNGLSKFFNNAWTNYTTSNSPLNRYINDVEIDGSNRSWISCGVRGAAAPSTTGIFYFENGSFKNFKEIYLYNEFTPTYYNATNLTRDIAGKIYFRINLFSDGIARVDGGVLGIFNFNFFNQGTGTFGSTFKIDNNGILWTLPKRGFYFYSADFSTYDPLLGGITYKNHRSLNINDVVAGINVGGDMHWDYANAKYEVPKGSGKNSVFSSALWIGAVDQGGVLHTAAQTYRQTGSDYWPGPIDGVNVPFDTSTCIQFDRIWKVWKWKVEEFKNEFLAGNVTNGTYPIAEELLTWPAKGNGIVDETMAPFVDFNLDGIYNPMDGDYPDIKGDQMLYYIFNDSLGIHTETAGQKLGIEVRVKAYAFNCSNIIDSNIVINRTTFYNYEIINRSSNDYDSMYVGVWSDMDLGNAIDDYVGCDTTRAAAFAYNGDNEDETASGYGLNPPMQNVKILRGVPADPGDGIDNDLDGTIDEPGERNSMNHFQYYNNVNNFPSGNPNGGQDIYNYLTSYWLDGTHVTYGGSGYNSSNILTNFMYSGVPYSGSGWTEISASLPPEDRRFVLSSGGFSFDSGDTATIDFAFVFTWDPLNPNGLATSIARNQADLDRVQYWFYNNNFPSCEVYSVGVNEMPPQSLITITPNPAKTEIYILGDIALLSGVEYAIYNVLGEEVTKGKLYGNSIKINSLPPQVYVLKLKTVKGNLFEKFVKQ